jgi:hypothetical protein
LTWSGIVVAGILFNGMGAALGAAIMSDPELNDAYTNDGFGQAVALIFAPLGGFGKFCLAIWWLGTSGNLIGNTYSNSIVSFLLVTRRTAHFRIPILNVFDRRLPRSLDLALRRSLASCSPLSRQSSMLSSPLRDANASSPFSKTFSPF